MANDSSSLRPRVLGLGMNGLVGSRVRKLLEAWDITLLSRKEGIDITKPENLNKIKNDTVHKYVFHFAAKTDVDGCEKDKIDDIRTLGYSDTRRQEEAWQHMNTAWAVNVYGTKNIVEACRVSGKILMYISTDFVFNGEDTPEGGYSEEDSPDPINWYAKTKYEGEKIVLTSGIPYIILRIAYPYRIAFEKKRDFANAMLQRLQNGDVVRAVTDHIMTPTYVDDIADALRVLVDEGMTGIFHVVGSSSLTPYDAASEIAHVFAIHNPRIEKTTLADFFQGKAPRPFNLTMKNDKIRQLGIKMKTFAKGLEEIKKQMSY